MFVTPSVLGAVGWVAGISSMDFVRDNLGEPVPEKNHPHTPIMVINRPLSGSSI